MKRDNPLLSQVLEKAEEILSSVLGKIDEVKEIDIERLELISTFVFVLFTTLVSMSGIVTLSRIDIVFPFIDYWQGASATNSDTSSQIGIFVFGSEQHFQIPELSRLAFVVVIGQIVNRTNQKVVEHTKLWSLVGIATYSVLLMINLDESFRVTWILSIQFIILSYYCIIVTGVFLYPHRTRLNRYYRDICSGSTSRERKGDSSEENRQENSTNSNSSQERKPRIRSPRN